jgi:hypothetical protein
MRAPQRQSATPLTPWQTQPEPGPEPEALRFDPGVARLRSLSSDEQVEEFLLGITEDDGGGGAEADGREDAESLGEGERRNHLPVVVHGHVVDTPRCVLCSVG